MADLSQQVQHAIEQWNAGRREQVLAALKRLIQREPHHPGANRFYGFALAESGQTEQGLYYVERAIKDDPGFVQAYHTLGTIKARTPDWEGAAAAFVRAAVLDPAHAESWWGLGSLMADHGRPQEAERALRTALELRPWHPDITVLLARLLNESARSPEALELLRAAAERSPANPLLLSVLAFTHNYLDITPEVALEAHRAFGRTLPSEPPPRPGTVPNNPDPERRLRIGYLSVDLREHPVATFFEHLLAHRDRAAFEVYCFHPSGMVDGTTQRLRALADHWRHVLPATGLRVREAVRADRIDILVDLCGHTCTPMLGAMARRLAPVQVHYMAYPNTTGMASIDARIVDAITDPPPPHPAQQWAVERLARVPGCFLCYTPRPDAPPPRMPPGPNIVFGSFNNPAKISDRTVELWARVLAATPGSRLLLKGKGLAAPSLRQRMADRFERAGVDPSRVECLSEMPELLEHLDAYARVDVALDPVPYNGTTTTCEALWMGVPVVVLEGNVHAARVGASLLTAAGLTDWIARSPEDYVRIAAALAADRGLRQALRGSLRERLAASALLNGAAHCRAVERVFRGLWGDWCAGRAPGAGGAGAAGG